MSDYQHETDRAGRIWIERDEQAKQGMARKGDMKNARAVPDHPYVTKEQKD